MKDMDSYLSEDQLQSYSDAELSQHIVASPSFNGSRVLRLSSNLLAKSYRFSELEDTIKAMDVARQLGICTPPIKRVTKNQQRACCIMERVQGVTLEDAWPKLSWFITIKLAIQLRGFIKRLRSGTSSTAGSLATGECRPFWLDDRYGLPASSSSENIACFFRFWANFTSMRKAIQAAAQGGAMDSKGRTPPTSKIFVFTHHDLAPRNILLTLSGELCLLDWDYAGFYPIYFEYASMRTFFIPQTWSLLARLRWYLFSWVAVGRYEQSAGILQRVRGKFTRFAGGRRFELLKNGGPSRYPVS